MKNATYPTDSPERSKAAVTKSEILFASLVDLKHTTGCKYCSEQVYKVEILWRPSTAGGGSKYANDMKKF